MYFDFTVVGSRVDGLVIYSKNLYVCFIKRFAMKNNQYLVSCDSNLKGTIEVNNIFLHRLTLFSFTRELYYSPTHHGPILNKNKIITIHDLTPLIIPEKSFKQFFYYTVLLPISARRSKRIITVSHFTKKLIEKKLKVPSNKISVIHNGTDIDQVDAAIVDGLPVQFFLMVGVHSKYKNFENSYHALRSVDLNMTLVVTGSYDKIAVFAKKDPNLIHLSQLNYAQIKYLYSHALALLYPSKLEGFGLPVLEAARLKCPIVTTIDSSMMEFLGRGAALYVNPESIKELTHSMSILLNSEYSKVMLDVAYQNTLSLTWEKHCNQVADLIKTEVNG